MQQFNQVLFFKHKLHFNDYKSIHGVLLNNKHKNITTRPFTM